MKACIIILVSVAHVVAHPVHGSNQALGSGSGWSGLLNTLHFTLPTSLVTATPVVKQVTTKPDDDVIKCGTKALIGRVVGGSKALPKSWPWQVGIKSCSTCMYFCGGTIVAKRWVVTAAHCLVNYRASDLYIEAGVTNQNGRNKHKQSFNATAILSHQSYALKAPYDEDIALLQLNKDVDFDDHVRPLCLNENNLRRGQSCTVTGYGKTSERGKKSAHLIQANVPIVANATCVQAYNKTKPPRPLTKNMVCAGFASGGVDACSGDSGGPLTCWDQTKQRFVLGGIVSWGVGCARKNAYGVYTDVKHLIPWITRRTGRIV